MRTKPPQPKAPSARRSSDVHVTQAMLYAVRDELKDDSTSLKYGLTSLRDEMHSLHHTQMSEIAKLSAQIHRSVGLAEEQNARNIAVIDSLTSLFYRQDRIETKVEEIEKTMASFRR